MTLEQAIETYDRTKRDCNEDEYPEWVKEVDSCLMRGTEPDARFAPWVTEVRNEVKGRSIFSMSDENK